MRYILGLVATACVSGLLAASVVLAGTRSVSSGERFLHYFRGGRDGSSPFGALIAGKFDNLYGTTAGGGGTGCQSGGGCGTIFKLYASGRETVLYAFKGGSDGAYPEGSLTVDGKGNYYGITNGGGGSDVGTVFRLAPDGTESVLYAFAGGSDGGVPVDNVVQDSAGNLYGAAAFGGNLVQCEDGCGVVYEVGPSGSESVLYDFNGGSDGWQPTSGVIRDGNGNLYGETGAGGVVCEGDSLGCGTVFELAPGGTESVLHAFQGGADGLIPVGGLVMDASGNLYGTTLSGGNGCASGCGTVFKIAPNGTHTVLYAFRGGADGEDPRAGVVMDSAGNLYGTTYFGGGSGCPRSSGCGAAFKLAPDGAETVLWAFGGHDGKYPSAALLLGEAGALYGTTPNGGKNNDGVVFELKK